MLLRIKELSRRLLYGIETQECECTAMALNLLRGASLGAPPSREGPGSQHSWVGVAAFLFGLFVLVAGTSAAKTESQGLQVRLYPTAAAHAKQEAAMSQFEMDIKSRLKPGVPVSPDRIRSQAREAYAATLTFKDWYDGFTPDSKKWLRKFLDNARPSGYTTFKAFLAANGRRTMTEIRDGYPKGSSSIKSLHKDELRLRRVPFLPTPPLLTPPPPSIHPLPAGPKPYDNIGGSKLVAFRSHDGAYRYHLTTPEQSIFLRGVPAIAGNSVGFPDYPSKNVYCDACCGPAAAQSILAWFNVPVRWSDGSVATTTYDIQNRLANLMETEDGADFTDPEDLDRVLRMDEFRGTRNYCYQKGGGTRPQLHYMLSRGTPVILLWATGDKAHYVTVYGYDVQNDLYNLANAEDLHWETLRHRWSFEAANDYTEFFLDLWGVEPYSLWSYCDTGCDTPWDYDFFLGLEGVTATSLPEVYYDTFISNYISGPSSPPLLNFYAYLSKSFILPWPFAEVSSGGEVTPLTGGNTYIIARTTPAAGPLTNNSVGQPIEITAELDKSFVDNYPDAYCGFFVLGVNGASTSMGYGPCAQQMVAALPETYQYRYRAPYDPSQRQVDFVVHGGLRKVSWPLGGCLQDQDLDGLCDRVDKDDDNDGVPDVNDNCPLVANPDQRDDNHNRIGLACDRCEQCMDAVARSHTAAPGGALVPLPPDGGCTCVHDCGWQYCHTSDDEELSPLDDDFIKVIHLVHSKWWDKLVGISSLPSIPPGPKPLPIDKDTMQIITQDIGAMLHFEARGVDPVAGQRALSDALFGPRGLRRHAPGISSTDRGDVPPP